MKPLHGEFKILRRCPCCQGRYSKHNSGKSNFNHGKTAARHRVKLALKKEVREEL